MIPFNLLITLELTGVNATERAQFDKALFGLGWIKLRHISTTWKCRKQKAGRHAAIRSIEKDLQYAKDLSTASRVDYALQLNHEEIHQSFK